MEMLNCMLFAHCPTRPLSLFQPAFQEHNLRHCCVHNLQPYSLSLYARDCCVCNPAFAKWKVVYNISPDDYPASKTDSLFYRQHLFFWITTTSPAILRGRQCCLLSCLLSSIVFIIVCEVNFLKSRCTSDISSSLACTSKWIWLLMIT